MYSKILKKTSAAAMAAAMALNGAVFSVSTANAADYHFEFEDAAITGDITVEKDSTASGGSYLKMTESGTIELTVNVKDAGTYNLTFYVSGIGGAKQQDLYINGDGAGSLSIPEAAGYTDVTVPGIKLNAGDNVIKISKSWGWSNFDCLDVSSFDYPEITATQKALSDYSATAEAKSLFAYLNSVYGEHIISGQQEIYQYGPHGYETEFDYLYNLTGHYPAIRGFDYGNRCCELFGANDDGSTDRIIDWVKEKGGIATASFHLNVPNDFKNYTGGTVPFDKTTYNATDSDFVASNAYKEGTKEYDYYRAALERLATEFKKLEAEGVPIIWRPLHEAEGGGGETGSWFWWGKEGSAVYRQLWQYTYLTLTEDFGCHNLIWEWNSYDFDTSANWYPGDAYVDIIGYDKYNCTKYLAENNWQPSIVHDDSAISNVFYSIMQRYNKAKMVAMSENDCFSTVDNLVNDKAGWLYFLTWYDGGSDNINFLSNPQFNTEADTIAMYQSDYCLTLDEMPADLYSASVDDPDPSVTTTKATTTAAVSTTTTTTASGSTTTTEADPSKEYGKIKQDATGATIITLPEPASDFFITVEVADGITYANGGLGLNVAVDGTNYWVNIKWEASKSGDVAINLEKNFLNCSIGAETVEDEDVIAAVKAALGKQDTFQAQVWYTSDSAGKAASTSDASITAAYIKTDSETTTTAATTGSSKVTLLGDANGDNKVSIADATAILQHLGNQDKYGLDEEGLANADVYNPGDGVSTMDAVTIQKLDAKQIDSLPEIPE